ncbi:MAG: SspB family protein [Xanthobacteraceae bacterium]
MAVDHIRYDILAQEALRGVVQTVLKDAAKNGLPGDHHFYITFETRAEGVRLPSRLLAQFPEAMTIVLQHQFWDLVVGDTSFEVGMSFGGIPERLTVPFASIKEFVDPSVPFGVKFEQVAEATATASAPAPAGEPQPAAEPKQTRTTPAVAAVPEPASEAQPSEDDPQAPASGGEVVSLDRFRKK